jgi:hypothetical protein
MRFSITLLSLVGSFCIGAALSSVYFDNKISNIKEDIISKEFSLLSMTRDTDIPCKQIRNTTGWYPQEYKKFTIFWKKSNNNSIIKLVIDNNYSSAVDRVDNSCHRE